MGSYFIINYRAIKPNDDDIKSYSTMIFSETLKELNDIIVIFTKSWFENEGYISAYVKVWRWEREETTYIFSGVINEYDNNTIAF